MYSRRILRLACAFGAHSDDVCPPSGLSFASWAPLLFQIVIHYSPMSHVIALIGASVPSSRRFGFIPPRGFFVLMMTPTGHCLSTLPRLFAVAQRGGVCRQIRCGRSHAPPWFQGVKKWRFGQLSFMSVSKDDPLDLSSLRHVSRVDRICPVFWFHNNHVLLQYHTEYSQFAL